MKTARLTLTFVSLLAGCSGGSTLASQAGSTPSSSCDTAGTPVLQGAVTLIVTAPSELISGTRASLVATAIDINGNRTDVTREVIWASTDDLTASAADGTLYATGAGPVTIRARLGEISASANVDIVGIELVSITLSAEVESAPAGATTVWHVIGHYNEGSTAELTSLAKWSSSDATVAVIDEPGIILARSPGMSLISVDVDGQAAAAPLQVTNPL